jgi:hypothetical protein
MNHINQINQINNFNYDNELNARLENRNKPSSPLQPLYEFRPVSTKYTLFHKIDEPVNQTNNSHNSYMYDPHQVFNPGDRAPIDYFMRNVDVESTLRSQFFALQKSPQAVYVPELNSQLYNNPMAYSPEFFSPTDATTEKAKCIVDNETLFYNCIRNNSKK